MIELPTLPNAAGQPLVEGDLGRTAICMIWSYFAKQDSRSRGSPRCLSSRQLGRTGHADG